MATKTEYQSVLGSIEDLEQQLDSSVALISSLDYGSEVYPHTSDIYTQIANIKSWSSGKINEIEKQEMLEGFLAQMRGLFIEYGAKLEILSASAENGYGMNYGMAEQDDGVIGFKLTIEKESLTASKIYETLILQGNNI